MLLERTRSHLNFEQIQQLLSIVFEYLALSKNHAQDSTASALSTRLELRNFAESLSGEWRRLRDEVFSCNKSILKILDYIQPKCDG
jgi:ABC-type cobalamin transport system ATPase subunit